MNAHPEANTQKSTTPEQLQELYDLAKRLGECFDSIALDERGKLRDRLTHKEDAQLMEVMAYTSRVTRQIRELSEKGIN